MMVAGVVMDDSQLRVYFSGVRITTVARHRLAGAVQMSEC